MLGLLEVRVAVLFFLTLSMGLFGTKYLTVDKVNFVEDSLWKIYLADSWILCLISGVVVLHFIEGNRIQDITKKIFA